MRPKNSETASARTGAARVRIASGDELGELDESIRKAIAYRAYELFDTRGRNHGHALEDWLHAERELIKPANIEISETPAEVLVRADVPGFGAGDVQVGLAPNRLILWGQLRAAEPAKGVMQLLGEIELPARVDPKEARASVAQGLFEFSAAKERKRAG